MTEGSIFATPWQKIVAATESLAESHHQLAQKIEADVERPLRDFAATNREVQAMSNISGNLTAMAKEVDSSKKKADKLRDKGAKAPVQKVAAAVQDVESATSTWESQAPYIFEKLQAVDESRLNHLRDTLTQFQTHEVDQVERNRVSAEETLNVLLNIETPDEIKMFALRMQNNSEQPKPGRKNSSVASPSRNLAPPPPPIQADDNTSQKSGSGMFILRQCFNASLTPASPRGQAFGVESQTIWHRAGAPQTELAPVRPRAFA